MGAGALTPDRLGSHMPSWSLRQETRRTRRKLAVALERAPSTVMHTSPPPAPRFSLPHSQPSAPSSDHTCCSHGPGSPLTRPPVVRRTLPERVTGVDAGACAGSIGSRFLCLCVSQTP